MQEEKPPHLILILPDYTSFSPLQIREAYAKLFSAETYEGVQIWELEHSPRELLSQNKRYTGAQMWGVRHKTKSEALQALRLFAQRSPLMEFAIDDCVYCALEGKTKERSFEILTKPLYLYAKLQLSQYLSDLVQKVP